MVSMDSIKLTRRPGLLQGINSINFNYITSLPSGIPIQDQKPLSNPENFPEKENSHNNFRPSVSLNYQMKAAKERNELANDLNGKKRFIECNQSSEYEDKNI